MATTKLRTYKVTITGAQPLLMHQDDIEWADEMEQWRSKRENARNSKAGDDRSPAHRWMGSLYRNEQGQIIIPTENIMRCLMEGGSGVPVPGKGKKTFKAQSQSGIMPRGVGWPLLVDGKPIDYKNIAPLMKKPDFRDHREAVEKLGFKLFVKRARIGASKHVRVRPRFNSWSARGELVVTDDQITTEVLMDILYHAGKYKGLGDWRPSSPKVPGTFGLFDAEVTLA